MTIEQIKTQLTLSQVLNYYHLKPDKNFRLNCPFHEDKTPSLQLYYKTHTCYCFSSNCKTHGKAMDVIDFIMHKESCTKHEAIMKAKEMIGGGTSKPMKELSKSIILTKIFTYFKNGVHNSKPTKAYLESRCLDFTKTEVGYNSGQFHYKLSGGDEAIKEYVRCGLLLELGTNSRFGKPAYKPFGKHCIVFPLRNHKEEIVSLYFRSIHNDKKQRHFYLKGREGLYQKYPPTATKKLILTEAIIDAATLLEQEQITKHYEILSLYGTNGLTEEHINCLSGLPELEEIVMFFDGDEAGRKAITKYAPLLKQDKKHVQISYVETPDGEDVNSLLRGHSSETLTHLIEKRKEHDFLFSSESASQRVEEIEIPQKQEEKINEKPIAKGLDTSNPYNLKYSSNIASYQIKGFKISQPDSLKITLQITVQ